MKSFDYNSLPDSQSQVQNWFRGKKLLSILVTVFSITAVALLITVSFTGSGNSSAVQVQTVASTSQNNGKLKLTAGAGSAEKFSNPNFKKSNGGSRIKIEEAKLTTAKIPYNFVRKSASPLVVRTTEGCVQGTELESRAGKIYKAFYNIPYAKPPVGQLRFRSPEPPENWTGIRDATKIGPECIQKEKYAPVLKSAGEEDCLHLNVFTSQLPTRANSADQCATNPVPAPVSATAGTTGTTVSPNYPVMFYVHGGGLNSGNGSRYGADYFMDEDVIVITFEFRIGVFGFMSTGDDSIPGNMGFKDIIMALRWVQKNIAAFGGDPKRVTIFGNSSGATMVHGLMLSTMSKGLFHSAISQSGTAIVQGGGVLPFPPIEIVRNVAIEVGCNGRSITTQEMVDCLRKVDASKLATLESPLLVFAPTPEPIPENGDLSDTFFSRPPYEIMLDADNYPMKVPWIVGDNSGEELSVTLQTLKDPELVRDLNENWVETIPKQMLFKNRPSDEKLESIKEFYFGHYIKRDVSNHTRFELLNMYTDHKWVHATQLAATTHAQHAPVFLYWLTKEAAKSYAQPFMGGFTAPFGVAHADELQYMFLYDGYPEVPIGSNYTRFSQKLVQNWVYFAATGIPALADWTPIDPADNGTVWFRLDDDDKTGMTHMLRRRVNFWNDFTFELYE